MDNLGVLEEQAVDAAISNNWERAIELNKQIIEQDKSNLGAYLRLGFAQLQASKLEDAVKAYKKALKLQPKHQIATENLERIEILLKQSTPEKKKEKKSLNPNIFLEIPGKTKTVPLSNLGQKQHLAELYVGEEVDLKNKKRRLEVRTMTGDYIGALPDDICKRLSFFLENASVYQTFIKEASLSRIVVFIKEVSKGEDVKGYISFPANNQPLMHPLQEQDADGEELLDDDDKDDTDWPDEMNVNTEEEEDKQDLLHIHTGSDDDDSEE